MAVGDIVLAVNMLIFLEDVATVV